MELILSCISIALSVFFSIFTILSSLKDKKLNMRNNYYDIFKKDLTETFPKFCSSFISDESFKINDEVGKKFENFIDEFMVKIRFLSYVDEKNYKKINSLLILLEEEIILLPTRKETIQNHINSFNKIVADIYKNINKHFS